MLSNQAHECEMDENSHSANTSCQNFGALAFAAWNARWSCPKFKHVVLQGKNDEEPRTSAYCWHTASRFVDISWKSGFTMCNRFKGMRDMGYNATLCNKLCFHPAKSERTQKVDIGKIGAHCLRILTSQVQTNIIIAHLWRVAYYEKETTQSTSCVGMFSFCLSPKT